MYISSWLIVIHAIEILTYGGSVAQRSELKIWLRKTRVQIPNSDYWWNLSSVILGTNLPRFVNSQLVFFLPVGILNFWMNEFMFEFEFEILNEWDFVIETLRNEDRRNDDGSCEKYYFSFIFCTFSCDFAWDFRTVKGKRFSLEGKQRLSNFVVWRSRCPQDPKSDISAAYQWR